MRIRVKFTKSGSMKYIGHLDVMRYFQKAIRRAGLDAAFSAGFSPHMLMTFAAPLGVGITSSGEYFDVDLNTVPDCDEFIRLMNEQMTPGFSVVSACRVPDQKKDNCMSLVAAADYIVCPASRRAEEVLPGDLSGEISDFMAQDHIVIMKKTKRNLQETDIRSWILDFRQCPGNEGFFMKISAGSIHNLKPEQLMAAFCERFGTEVGRDDLRIRRCEIYALQEHTGMLVPLGDLGEAF